MSELERIRAFFEGDVFATSATGIYIDEIGEKHVFKAIWNGRISLKEEGSNGFGYDPIFISEDANGKTIASLPVEFKEQYSHRAKAVRMLLEYLKKG